MIPHVVPKLEEMDPPTAPMLLPSFPGGHNLVIFRPATQDDHLFSSQFYNPETFSIFNVSPARIDPGLHTNEPTMSIDPRMRPMDSVTPTKSRLPPMASPGAMWPIRLSPMKINNEPSSSTLGPVRPSSSFKSATVPLRYKNSNKNKRYQYWTPAEDKLVRYLREDLSWTWKDISQELHRKLNGVHSWQAVQMRYLRAIRARPDAEEAREAREAPEALEDAPAICAAPKPTMDEVEDAIKRDWDTRWVRLSAVLGNDITTNDCSELLASPHESVRNFVEPE